MFEQMKEMCILKSNFTSNLTFQRNDNTHFIEWHHEPKWSDFTVEMGSRISFYTHVTVYAAPEDNQYET